MSEDQEQLTPEKVAFEPLVWEADEHVHTDKGKDWYWALGLMAVALAVGALLFNNVLFAVFVLVAAVVLAMLASQKPRRVTFAVTQRGVRVDDKLYPYQSIETFGVEEQDVNSTDADKLILQLKSNFAMNVIIPLVGVDSDEVHTRIGAFVPEEDLVEPLTHRVMEALGF